MGDEGFLGCSENRHRNKRVTTQWKVGKKRPKKERRNVGRYGTKGRGEARFKPGEETETGNPIKGRGLEVPWKDPWGKSAREGEGMNEKDPMRGRSRKKQKKFADWGPEKKNCG